MKQIEHYPKHIKEDVKNIIKNNKLGIYLKTKYPTKHQINNDKILYDYTMKYKNEYFKKYPISKINYDSKINILENALGVHTFISRVQGNKLKRKNEIKISTIFKNVPKEFLDMIIVHELCHFKEKEHNKAFYDLCTYVLKDYHQLEFDLRLYLIHLDKFGKLY